MYIETEHDMFICSNLECSSSTSKETGNNVLFFSGHSPALKFTKFLFNVDKTMLQLFMGVI